MKLGSSEGSAESGHHRVLDIGLNNGWRVSHQGVTEGVREAWMCESGKDWGGGVQRACPGLLDVTRSRDRFVSTRDRTG